MRKSTILKEAGLVELTRKILQKGNSIRFQVKGWSMRPFIRNGDFITVSPAKDSSIKVGNIVFYLTTENKAIVHRVIQKRKKNGNTILSVKGDASFSPPDKVDLKNVIGTVTAVERNGKKKRLDTEFSQMKSFLIAATSPLSKWIYPLGSIAKQIGQIIPGRTCH